MRLAPAAALVVAFALAACGGSSDGRRTPDGGGGGPTAPTASLVAPTGTELGSRDPVIVRFSQSVDPATLALGGTLASDAPTSSWSQTAAANDTLTLTPSPRWSVGAGKTLTVSAGNANGTATLSQTFNVVESVFVEFTSAPPALTNQTSAQFTLSCEPADCAVQCALDAAALSACPSPLSYSGLADGEHTLRVVATWGAQQREITHTWTVDTVGPTAISGGFTGYGTATFTFDEPIDPAFAQDLSHYALSPAKPAGIAVKSASAQGATLTVNFAPYQLPRAYTLTFDVRDLAGNTRSAVPGALPVGAVGSRVAFVSAAEGTGNFSSWPGATGTGLAAADSLCQAEATAAGLVGTFRAFASDDTDDAGCRLLRLGGKQSASCGQATAPVADTGPWIGTDGLPIVATHAELIRGKVLRQISFQADGTRVTTPKTIWHGTSVSGTSAGAANVGANCVNWTSAASGNSPSRRPTRPPCSRSSSSGTRTAPRPSIGCSASRSTGARTPGFGEGYRAPGKGAFVSSTTYASGAFVSGTAHRRRRRRRALSAAGARRGAGEPRAVRGLALDLDHRRRLPRARRQRQGERRARVRTGDAAGDRPMGDLVRVPVRQRPDQPPLPGHLERDRPRRAGQPAHRQRQSLDRHDERGPSLRLELPGLDLGSFGRRRPRRGLSIDLKNWSYRVEPGLLLERPVARPGRLLCLER